MFEGIIFFFFSRIPCCWATNMDYTLVCLLCLLISLAPSGGKARNQETQRPNIIVIVADDLVSRKTIVVDIHITGELGYDRLNGTRKIGLSYAKSVVYIWQILDMHRTGTKHIVRYMQKSVVQWSVISKFTCIYSAILTNVYIMIF